MRRLERRRARERTQELDPLRRGEQLDAEDVRGVGDHRLQAARGEGRHGDMVFLVGAGRQAVDARRMGERLVLARQRRGGDVGDHEAAVQARLGREERRQARDAGVDQHRDAALGDRADLGDRDRHRVGGERDRLGVEVAARDDAAFGAVIADEDQRVVGHRVGLAHEHERGVAQLVEAGADHLRLAAQAVRILDAVVALQMRASGSRCPRAGRGSSARRRSGRAGRAARGCAGRTAPSLPRAASTVSAPITSAASSTGSNVNSACSASAVETCVPLMSARPSLAASASGARPARAQHLGRRTTRAVDDELAFADQRQRQVRERREVARGADRSLRRNERNEAGVVDREQRVDDDLAHARVAARQARRLQAEHQPHDRRGSASPTPTLCERIRLSCRLGQVAGVDARSGELAEAGVDAVDRRGAGGGALHDRGAGADAARAPASMRSVAPPTCSRCRSSSDSVPSTRSRVVGGALIRA